MSRSVTRGAILDKNDRWRKMVAPAEVAIRVVEAPYSLLETAGLPFSVCVELQENKLDISSVAWTVRKSKSGLLLQLFWPLSVDGPSSGSFVQPPKRAGVRVNNYHRLRATCDKITQTHRRHHLSGLPLPVMTPWTLSYSQIVAIIQ